MYSRICNEKGLYTLLVIGSRFDIKFTATLTDTGNIVTKK